VIVTVHGAASMSCLADRSLKSYSGSEMRLCGVCARDVELDALTPGWTVARVDGEPTWSCPDCSREANAERRG
jgi:hypothetical protein